MRLCRCVPRKHDWSSTSAVRNGESWFDRGGAVSGSVFMLSLDSVLCASHVQDFLFCQKWLMTSNCVVNIYFKSDCLLCLGNKKKTRRRILFLLSILVWPCSCSAPIPPVLCPLLWNWTIFWDELPDFLRVGRIRELHTDRFCCLSWRYPHWPPGRE